MKYEYAVPVLGTDSTAETKVLEEKAVPMVGTDRRKLKYSKKKPYQ